MTLDLKSHLLRQMAFSHQAYGPGERRKGVCDHLKKEIEEMEKGHGESAEWVDIVILALDGLTQRLAYCYGDSRNDPIDVAETACRMIEAKQGRNEGRTWPDWRTAPADQAIEHVRETRDAS